MAGIYREFTVNSVTPAQYRAANDLLRQQDLSGINWSVVYSSSTQIFKLSIAIDTERLPTNVTAADIRTRIRTFFQNRFGRLPDADVVKNAGDSIMTPMDRVRQLITAQTNNVDPITVGVNGPTLEERKARLARLIDVSRGPWGL
jgi:hypothetical protein